MGHRNPKVCYMMRKKIILSTEHGQRGGDEVNLIFDNENGRFLLWMADCFTVIIMVAEFFDKKNRTI